MNSFFSHVLLLKSWRLAPLVCALLVLLPGQSPETALAAEPAPKLNAGAWVAGDQPWLKLLRPDSLAGWTYGFNEPAGWTIKEGVLSTTGPATAILSGFSVGNFELRAEAEVAEVGQLTLRLSRIGAKGDQDIPLSGKVTLHRTGNKLIIAGPVGIAGEREVPAHARYCFSLLATGPAKLTQLEFREPAGEPLFNGTDLTGWHTPGSKDAWHVEEGMIVKRGGGGNYLRTEKEYGNFTLSLDYKMSKGNNSGIGIRTAKNGWPSGDGMELQLLDKPGTDFGSNMSIYRNVEPLATAHKSEEWNHAVIKADGYMISAWVNGELVQQANTYRHPELQFRHLQGWIGFQDHGGVAEFKNIRLLPSPAANSETGEGFGPREWTRPLTPNGAELVLNRLMNQEAISQSDGIRSSIVEVSVFSQEEKTLVDLTGPGALVGINVLEGGGTLAFYFDDETKPRFAGQVKSLRGKLPILADQTEPLVTYVPFAKRLKIVQLPSLGGRFLIESVSLPTEDVTTVTMGDPAETLPRGWQAAIDYRHNHYKYGQHRENDPQPRAGEKDKTIEPGSAAPLLSIAGTGLVQWWKLHADPKYLQNDDLWLEITVDGEQQPAISAPARYLFAPIADEHKHNNFLFTHAGGFFSGLAMPYMGGITIQARNKGEKPLTGLGMTVSYIPADDAVAELAYIGRKRLRATYLDAKSPNVVVEGIGRVVGLVCDNSQTEGDMARGKLLLDDKPLAGWKLGNYDLLLGMTKDAESRQVFSGHTPQLAWRYFLLAPPEFEKSLTIEADQPGKPKLVLYYLALP